MARTTLPALFGYALVPILSGWLVPTFGWGRRLILLVPVIPLAYFLIAFRIAIFAPLIS